MPNNGIPIYLHIDSPTVTANNYFGSNSSHITDVWATTGSHNLCAYEMPADIPILVQGNAPIAVSAGIWDDGIVSIPVQYPFYRPDTFTIPDAIPGHVYHHKPVYSYFDNTKIAFPVQDFEATGNLFTNLVTVSGGFESSRCAALIVAASDSFKRAEQAIPIQINSNGRPAYIELNYRMNNLNMLLEVGITGKVWSFGQFVNPTDYPASVLLKGNGAWVKTYLNFNNAVGVNSANSQNADNYIQVYFRAYHNGGQQDTVFLDNIKLLYFQ